MIALVHLALVQASGFGSAHCDFGTRRGGTLLKDVSFAVFQMTRSRGRLCRSAVEVWSKLPSFGLRSLRWTQDGVVELEWKSAPADPRHSNLFFDNDHLVIAAEFAAA